MNKSCIVFTFFLGLAWLIGCSEDEITFNDQGLITGIDARLCACCGGWFVEIGDSTYRFQELPLSSNIALEENLFPISVQLNWRSVDEPCLGDEIVVLSIEELAP